MPGIKKSLQQPRDFPIVGIGASAGGLAAITDILHSVPPDSNLAVVLIQHLAPDHESLGPEILSRATKMPVDVAKNNIAVEPNHVYVIPPNFEMTISRRRLKLRALGKPRHHKLVIDSFLQSLATDQKELAIGVILSGTATDGTQGLKAIKAAGGLTIAQDPISAEYDGMPESAIASGAVDLVLPPQEIARELVQIAKRPYKKRHDKWDGDKWDNDKWDSDESAKKIPQANALRTIFSLLKNQTRIDFAGYKQSTVIRRIERRMRIRRYKHFDAYAKYLQKNPKEVTDLYNDIFIHVTQFFRDPSAFEKLRTVAFRQIVKNKNAATPIRIWAPGCSTGEEVYSIAIMLIEFLSRSSAKIPIQIFATDISDASIQKARLGEYPSDIERTVSKERLQNFFDKTDKGYRIKQSIRDLCLFTKHDVAIDPPFSKLDLISCRNVLIYFAMDLQKRVIPQFHYALNLGGFLFLGNSESLGSYSKLFSPVDKTYRIYSKEDVPTPMLPRAHVIFGTETLNLPQIPAGKPASTTDYQRDAEKIAVSRYAPPSVIVSSDMEILRFQGRTAPYLEPSSGPPSNNLFKMIRPEILHNLRSAVRSAIKNNGPVRLVNLTFEIGGRRKAISIEVAPVNPSAPPKQRKYVIFFEDDMSAHPKAVAGRKKVVVKKPIQGRDMRIEQLEQELFDSRCALKDLKKEFETAQEELTATNEELQSANEDLQSTNEEVETSKEELQSSNEELTTINDELQNRNVELVRLSSDLSNVLNSVEMPMVIVGKDIRIRRFTPSAQTLFNLIPSDVGRPLSDIKPNFQTDLEALVKKTMTSRVRQECEIQLTSGQWVRLQVRPYKTIENRLDGAVITLIDIHLLKEHLIESEAAVKYATSVANTLQLPLLVVDENLRLLSANRSFAKVFGINATKKIGSDIFGLLAEYDCDVQSLKKPLNDVIDKNNELTSYPVELNLPSVGRRQFSLSANSINWQNTMPKALLLSMEDVTERTILLENEKKARTMADQALGEAKLASETKDLFLATLSHELRTPLSSILSWAQLIQKSNLDSEKLKHGLQTIERSAKVQGQLIEDLLDIARIQSGKLQIHFKEVDPVVPVDATIAALRPVAEKAGIKIDFETSLKSETVWGDSERIQQMAWNLLNNAIKFSPPETTIRIRLEVVDDNDRKFVSIKVADQGKGIKPDFLPKLFERFSQADSSSVRLHGGLGLGLALVRELSELHGGKVRAESAGENQGATFTILLPVTSPVSAGGKTASAQKASVDEHDSPNLSGLCVLIVEDDVSTLDALSETLISYGAKTILRSSVAAALKDFAITKPDLLVSDIGLPSEDGYSLIRQIRSLGPAQNGDIPALALTAYAKKADVHRALNAGFNAHMPKPFDTRELGQAVAKLAQSLHAKRLE